MLLPPSSAIVISDSLSIEFSNPRERERDGSGSENEIFSSVNERQIKFHVWIQTENDRVIQV